MTAWELLVANSTLLVGTAWDHFNNQKVGGGTGEFLPPTISINLLEQYQNLVSISSTSDVSSQIYDDTSSVKISEAPSIKVIVTEL